MVLGAAMVAGATGFNDFLGGLSPVVLPLILGAIGIVTSIMGTFLVKVKDGGSSKKLSTAENLLPLQLIAASYFVIVKFLPETWVYNEITYTSMGVF